MSNLQFDRWQFDGRYHLIYAVSAETKLTYSDYERMGTDIKVSPKHSRWIPAFASNNEQLKKVLLECFRRAQPAITNKRFLRSEEGRKHIASVARAGSYMAFIGAIAYRSWRLRWDSVQIAIEMEIKPAVVRGYLNKMVMVARALGFETYEPEKRFGRHYSEAEREARRIARMKARARRLPKRSRAKTINPAYIEGVNCWDCKINLIDKTRSKWRCTECLDAVNRQEIKARQQRRMAA